MNIIQTKGAPAAIGPYSQGISTGKLLFTSGQLPVNPADGAMPEGIAAQAEWSCKNVGAILEAAGSGFEKVVKTTCFLADIADFAAFNEVYARYFTSKPARSCVAVKDLPKGAPLESAAVLQSGDNTSRFFVASRYGFGAFCHPFKESSFADLDKPATAERRKAGGVYQLIGARS